MSVLRQNILIPRYILINCYTDVIPKSTFIFPYHLASYHEMTHTQNHLGSQSESDTLCLDSHISDKQDPKALLLLLLLLLLLFCHCAVTGLEMKGYTQIEGQSTQGSYK